MGTLMGFKALTAALLGGIGSLPGAFLGGFIIAAHRVLHGGIPRLANGRISPYSRVLVLVLLFRPAGLAGHPDGRKRLDERP